MTKEQKIELCKIYNNSDIDSFKYMMQFCDNEQKELLKRLRNCRKIKCTI